MRDLEQLFKGLADQTRLRILNLLIHGELCVCDIQYVLESSQPNVSRDLLEEFGAGAGSPRRRPDVLPVGAAIRRSEQDPIWIPA